jgi:MerR family transcriptional regulator, light-induced transcriptional regulator
MEREIRELERTAERVADPSSGATVIDFACEVMARLASRQDDLPDPARADPALVARLVALVSDPGPDGLAEAFVALRSDLRRMGVTPALLSDLYIPEAARQLGADWVADCRSFVEVTTATARLQTLLRDCARMIPDGNPRDPLGGTVLVVVPEDEQHTLGAVTLAEHLRRRGLSVRLAIGRPLAEIGGLAADGHFNGAIISFASSRQADAVAAITKTLKTATNRTLPVAIGGAMATLHPLDARRIGADVVTNDLGVVLDLFSVATQRQRQGRF